MDIPKKVTYLDHPFPFNLKVCSFYSLSYWLNIHIYIPKAIHLSRSRSQGREQTSHPLIGDIGLPSLLITRGSSITLNFLINCLGKILIYVTFPFIRLDRIVISLSYWLNIHIQIPKAIHLSRSKSQGGERTSNPLIGDVGLL